MLDVLRDTRSETVVLEPDGPLDFGPDYAVFIGPLVEVLVLVHGRWLVTLQHHVVVNMRLFILSQLRILLSLTAL